MDIFTQNRRSERKLTNKTRIERERDFEAKEEKLGTWVMVSEEEDEKNQRRGLGVRNEKRERWNVIRNWNELKCNGIYTSLTKKSDWGSNFFIFSYE